uniref:Cytochrome c oxidase subunit VIa n=1 Tax=Coccidioides immitis TaxID=5501 RepID=A4URR9_COCIT|nr:cytochrome c oxidase subunit VIa [Coccidioides immitis]
MFLQRSVIRAAQGGASRLLYSRVPLGLQRRSMASESKLRNLPDIKFNREREAVKAHAAATNLWRKLSIYVVIPALILGSLNAWNLWNEHWEHWEHMPPLEERVEYPYQNIRSKNFPWGDGDKVIIKLIPIIYLLI